MREQDSEQRDEERAEQKEEVLVAAQVEGERADRRGDRDEHDERALRNAGDEVLERDRARVDVGEGLVGLVDGDREHGERGGQARAHDRCRQLGGIREPARQHEQHAEHEHPGRRHEVAEPGAPPRCASVAREARVVGDQRHPRNGDRDHEVHPDPEREAALGLRVPELREVCLGSDHQVRYASDASTTYTA